MGGVGNGAAEEDWCWDLNPGAAAILGRGPCGFGGVGGENHAALAEKGERSKQFWRRRDRTMWLWWSRGREPQGFGRVGTPWWEHS